MLKSDLVKNVQATYGRAPTINIANGIVAEVEGFNVFQIANVFGNRLEVVSTQINRCETFEVSRIELACVRFWERSALKS